MFRRLTQFTLLFALVLLPSVAMAFPLGGTVRAVGRGCTNLGHAIRAAVVIDIGGSANYSRGGSGSASFRIFYHRGQSIESAFEGGVIYPTDNGFLMVPEFDRPVMSITARTASGWHQSWVNPQFQYQPRTGVNGLRFSPGLRLPQEVLTIVVQYCDARNVPDGEPQIYEYTIDRSFRRIHERGER